MRTIKQFVCLFLYVCKNYTVCVYVCVCVCVCVCVVVEWILYVSKIGPCGIGENCVRSVLVCV